jgi:hypothetical protein
MRQWLALCGDKSDNVPGVAGCGKVRAAELLNTIGDLESIRKAVLAGDERIKPAMAKALGEAFESGALTQSYELVGLKTDAPIESAELESDMTEDDAPEQIGYDEPEQSPETDTQTKAIVVDKPLPMAPAKWEHGLEPPTANDAMWMAGALAASRLYLKFPNKESIFAVIIRGRELGLGALTALDNFHVIEGKPALSAQLIQARAEQHPDCEYFMPGECSETEATFETKRKSHPRPVTLTYTIDQAKRAGLIRNGSGWTKHPEDMLAKTAAVKLARRVYPSSVAGLYSPEELGAD